MKRFAWHLLALYLIGISVEGLTAETATLVLGGSASPDGNGVISGIEPVLALNNNGQVAFVASLTGTKNPSTDARGIFIADTNTVTKLVRTGETTPDGNGTFKHFTFEFGPIERLVINDNGTVAFMALLTGTAGGSTDNVGLFSASADGAIKKFVRVADPTPDGNGVFAKTPPDGFQFPEVPAIGISLPGIDNSGRAVFHGILTGTSGGLGVDDTGVFWSDGNNITRVSRAGEAVTGEDETVETIFLEFASSLGGQVAIHTYLVSDFMDEPGHRRDDLERIYRRTGDVMEEVVRSGITITDGNGQLAGISFGSIGIADNGKVTFLGGVGNSDNYLLDRIRLFQTDGTTLTQIVRTGQLPPGEPDEPGKKPFQLEYIIDSDSSSHAEVVFSAVLERNEIPPDNRSSGIYLGDGNSLSLVVHEGDALPVGNGTFGSVAVPLFMNSSGEFAFSAAINGTNDPGDYRGIFFVDSDRTIHTVARKGMPLAGSTIFFAFFLGDFKNESKMDISKLSLGGMNAINDSGQVVFSAMLADGRAGIFLWQASDGPPDDDTIFADDFE